MTSRSRWRASGAPLLFGLSLFDFLTSTCQKIRFLETEGNSGVKVVTYVSIVDNTLLRDILAYSGALSESVAHDRSSHRFIIMVRAVPPQLHVILA